MQRIHEAVASLDPSRPRQFAKDGSPKVSRVSRLVGTRLTRPMIDAAMAETNSTPASARARTQGPRKPAAAPKAEAEPVSKPDELPQPDLDPRSFLARARQPHRRDLTVEQVVGALTATGGARAAAAQRLGVTRSAITKFCKRHPEVAEAAEEIRNTFVDLAEAQLIKAAQNGEGWAIRYLLDNQGAELGYGRKMVVKGDPDHPIHTTTEQTYNFDYLSRGEKRQMLDLMRKARGAKGDASSI